MKYEPKVLLLSSEFEQKYPYNLYPELMYKIGRPYVCLLIPKNNYYICIPFRSSIKHKNAFMFKHSLRSKKLKSGLDYSKIVLIKDFNDFDLDREAIVDQDEYVETIQNITKIIQEVEDYINTYINHIKGISILHKREFERKYQHSTLLYFHTILGL